MDAPRKARPVPDATGMRVELRDVGHGFDRTGADMLFRHVTLTLLPRHVYALTGPSGSGKSTLLSIIAGWTRPTQGEVDRHDCGRVNWVLQNPHGVARRSAVDHVALPFLARGERRREARAHAMALLDEFGLASLADKPFSDLSGGEAQRLMLARGVASGAGLLLVDEPTAQLDLSTAATVNERLNRLSLSGAIVVIATHDPRTRDACTDLIDLRDYQGDGPAGDAGASGDAGTAGETEASGDAGMSVGKATSAMTPAESATVPGREVSDANAA